MALAAGLFGLTALVLPPARARADRDGETAAPKLVSKASSGGAPRLVRIGPQALIEVHADGRMTMVDEAPPRTSRAAGLAILLGATMGIAVVPVALPTLAATNPSPVR
jgi:hypothetical protein